MKKKTSNYSVDKVVGFGEAGDQYEHDSKNVRRKVGNITHGSGHFGAGIHLPPDSKESVKRVLPALKVKPIEKGQKLYSK